MFSKTQQFLKLGHYEASREQLEIGAITWTLVKFKLRFPVSEASALKTTETEISGPNFDIRDRSIHFVCLFVF